MRSLLTLSLLLLTLPALVAAPAEAQVEPTDDGRYLVSRAVVEDYVVCEAEARVLGATLARQDAVVEQAGRAVASLSAEADALRRATDACARRSRMTGARLDVAQAQIDAEREARARAERSAGRWRLAAVAGGGAAVVLGALRALSL